VAADRDDEPGVLGNLPRSRPGRRSDKRRSTTSATRAKQQPPAKKPAAARAKPSTTRAKPRPRPQAQPRSRPAPQPSARKSNPDPVGQAFELAGKVAAVGVRTAAGIVKRLPRP
jgi:hypothetical protein